SRIIRMRDGLVFGDDCGVDQAPGARKFADSGELGTREVTLQPSQEPRSDADAPLPHRRTARDDARFLVRTTSTALRSLRRNTMRSALTTLGIIIGVGSLLAIAEIGKGAWTAIRALLSKTGVDNIVIQAGAASRNGVSLGSGSVKTLTPEDAETILNECPSVDSLAPL